MKRYSIHSLINGDTSSEPIKQPIQKYGIEIEVEGVSAAVQEALNSSQTIGKYWSLVGDGSLRNHGVEFVSRVLNKEDTTPALEVFYSAYDRFNMRSTMRCGIHIHANCLDLYVDELPGLFTTYALAEPLFMEYCGDVREENIYCVPWYRATTEPEKLADIYRSDKYRGAMLRATFGSACKYSALNAAPLVRFGTVEFRHAPTWGTLEPTKIWASLVDKLMMYGPRRAPKDILLAWHNDPVLWYRQVFGTEHGMNLTRTAHLAEERGAVGVAEKFLPPTKGKATDWSAPSLYVQGEGVRDYAISTPRPPAVEGTRTPRPARQGRERARIDVAPALEAAEARVTTGLTTGTLAAPTWAEATVDTLDRYMNDPTREAWRRTVTATPRRR